MRHNPRQRLDGKAKLVKFTADQSSKLRAYCRDHGIESESELIRQAVNKYIDPDYDDATNMMKGVLNLQNTINKIDKKTEVIYHYLRYSDINFLAYHPQIDPALAEAAFRSAQARHKVFFDKFKELLQIEAPLFEQLLHSYYYEQKDNNEPD